jgi:hypothetical protein
MARTYSDATVTLTLLWTLIRSGMDEDRRAVLSLALGTGKPRLQRLAAEAMFHEHEHITAEFARRIPNKALLRRGGMRPDIRYWLRAIDWAASFSQARWLRWRGSVTRSGFRPK